jgi:hypothetical protein
VIPMFTVHRVSRAGFLAVAVAASLAATSPAWATPPAPTTYNNANVQILGGDARAVSACVVLAKTSIRHHRRAPQTQMCNNFSEADAGSANLRHVSVFIDQEGGSGHRTRTVNNADVTIAGGDATAVASCLAYLGNHASAEQTQECENTAVATGGDANLQNVDITIIQTH